MASGAYKSPLTLQAVPGVSVSELRGQSVAFREEFSKCLLWLFAIVSFAVFSACVLT